MLGIEALLDLLAAADVRYVFGNPGTTELPLNEALVTDSRFQYIFALQEVPLTAMAEGYALASGKMGVASVHTCCGLGNAMGMLYNAYSEGCPLLVLAGQQDRRLLFDDPVLSGDMINVARPWTKWAVEVQRAEDIPNAVRRALQVALTPPTGPVFMAIPLDVQLEEVEGLDLRPAHIPDRRVRPPLEALKKAAILLAEAHNPLILAGSRVVEAGAVEDLVGLAEQIGAPVFAESTTSHARLPMPAGHPQYAGGLGLWGKDVYAQLMGFDVIFVVGMDFLRLYIHGEPTCPIPKEARLIHLDNKPREIGKNYPLELGLPGDPKAGLGELQQEIASIQTDTQQRLAAQRRKIQAVQRQRELEILQEEIHREQDRRPMTARTFMSALARVLPENVAVVEEAVTTHYNLFEKLSVFTDPSGHIGHRGWALGWGVGCAIGVKLAWPERPVIALLGDGASLYGIQGLWTAAHHHIPVIFIIANNSQYKILKISGEVLGLPQVRQKNYLGMDLTHPAIDFVSLARSFGVEARRVHEPDELSEVVRGALNRKEPLLLDVPLEG